MIAVDICYSRKKNSTGNSILSPESIVRLRLNTYFGQLVGRMNKLLPGEYDTRKWVPSVAETQGKPKRIFKKSIVIDLLIFIFLLYYLNVYFIIFLWAILVDSASISLQLFGGILSLSVHFWELCEMYLIYLCHSLRSSELTVQGPCYDSVLVMGEHELANVIRDHYNAHFLKRHILCIHAGLFSCLEYIISFNRVIDIQYFIALLILLC